MAFDFPTTPANGDEFTPVGGPTYVYKAPAWLVKTDKSAGDLYVKKAGDVMTGGLEINPGALTVRGASHGLITADTGATGMNSGLWMYERGKARWALYKHGAAESGANAGSDLRIDRHDDTGAALGGVLIFSRASGLITFPSGQLAFPAVQNPSAGANTLDDYEEGFWVPAWGGSTTQPTIGNGTLSGAYVKNGRIVTALVSLTFGSTTTPGSGYWSFSMPFAAASVAYLSGGGITMADSGVGYFGGATIGQNASAVIMISNSNTLIGSGIPFAWGVADTLTLNLTYQAAA